MRLKDRVAIIMEQGEESDGPLPWRMPVKALA